MTLHIDTNDINAIKENIVKFCDLLSVENKEWVQRIAACLLDFLGAYAESRVDFTGRISEDDAAKLVRIAFKSLPYDDYLKTRHWKYKRQKSLERFKSACAVCCSDVELNVHHRTYDNIGCEKMEDLTVLCRKCHELFHKKLPISDRPGLISVTL